ncbi:hypothetical protein ACFX2I_028338 [Malus domestica]
MCKIFVTILQGKAQDWLHNLPPQSIQSFNELSLFSTKEYSSYRSIKKKSDHLFNVKKNLKELLRNYVKRFKVEKAKIIICNDSITSVAFQKGLLVDQLLFEEFIMKEYLTLADSFALAEKHALWNEAGRADKAPEHPRKESAVTQTNEDVKQYNNQIRQEAKCRDRSSTKGDISNLDHTKYCVFHRGPDHAIDDCYT